MNFDTDLVKDMNEIKDDFLVTQKNIWNDDSVEYCMLYKA